MGEQKRYVKRLLISINQYKDIPQQRNHPSAGLFSFIGSGKAIYSTFSEQIRRRKEKRATKVDIICFAARDELKTGK